jgi:PRTRC genetic system protein C
MPKVTTTTLGRVFKFNSIEFDDPDINKSPDQVREFYSGIYPELNNAIVKDGIQEGDDMVYEFNINIGTKG